MPDEIVATNVPPAEPSQLQPFKSLVLEEPGRAVAAILDAPRRKRAEQIVSDQMKLFQKGDTVSLINFGSSAQKDLAVTSSTLLGAIKTRDTGAASDILLDLTNTIDALDVTLPFKEKVRRIPLIGNWVTGVMLFIEKAEKASGKLNKIRVGLESAHAREIETVTTLDVLYKNNAVGIDRLEEWIAAGEMMLAEVQREYESRKLAALASGDLRQIQDVADLYSRCRALDFRVHNIRSVRIKAITDMPLIRNTQEASIQTATMLRDGIVLGIPEFEKMVIIAKANADQMRTAELYARFRTKINELAKANAEATGRNLAAIKELQRTGIFEIDTIVDIVTRLRETATLVQQKDEENAKAWRDAEAKMEEQLNLLRESQLAGASRLLQATT